MKLLISHPDLAPDLVYALNETDCLAARTGPNTVQVFAPWLVDGGDAAQAAAELLFFVKAWAAAATRSSGQRCSTRTRLRWTSGTRRREPRSPRDRARTRSGELRCGS